MSQRNIYKDKIMQSEIERGNGFEWDLKIGHIKENELATMFSNGATFEVKYDQYDNDRFFIEYKRYNTQGEIELTGLSVTKADYYVLCKQSYYLIVPTQYMKGMLKTLNRKHTLGGDGNRTIGILVTEGEVLDYCRTLK
jgi:hypothetical protein